MSEKIMGFTENITKFKKDINQQYKDIEKRLKILETKSHHDQVLEYKEQDVYDSYSFIFGVEEDDKEDVKRIVMTLGFMAGMFISPNDIVKCYRMEVKNVGPSPICVQFISEDLRNTWAKCIEQLKHHDTTVTALSDENKLVENLLSSIFEVLNVADAAVKGGNIYGYYRYKNSIFVQLTRNARPYHVRDIKHLRNLIYKNTVAMINLPATTTASSSKDEQSTKKKLPTLPTKPPMYCYDFSNIFKDNLQLRSIFTGVNQ